MAFTVFTSGTTAYATELMDNFVAARAGDLVPYATSTSGLTATTASLNIGSSSYKWDTIYLTTYTDTAYKEVVLVDQYFTSAAEIQVTGLTETSEYYRVYVKGEVAVSAGATEVISMAFNQYTGSGFYLSTVKTGDGNTVGSGSISFYDCIMCAVDAGAATTGSISFFADCYVKRKFSYFSGVTERKTSMLSYATGLVSGNFVDENRISFGMYNTLPAAGWTQLSYFTIRDIAGATMTNIHLLVLAYGQ